MLLDGRDYSKQFSENTLVTEVLTYSYLKVSSVKEFIEDLRRTDYQIVTKIKEVLK